MPSNKKKHPRVSGSFFEQMKESGQSPTPTLKKDLLNQTTEGLMEQVFGLPKRGELKEGQVLEVQRSKGEAKPAFFEIKKQETLLFVKEQEIAQEVEAARSELKKAVKELEKLGQDVAQVEKAVDQIPVKPGIYHLTFFERLRQIIQFFRERIEESRTWLSLMVSKKKQRKYWSLYKKHGTKFGLSGERVVSTQTG